ncbi:MAG TPA: translation initiation factor IF-3 [Gammaproteobacteria bacterium]|nr:translation initiation factor IF-3 [Gammaproteobacteria bacterium]HIB25954.1 translation initiation factor IF-3 [Gammaproteobacteria bacterium]HIG34711.1 translation initiation factor IF-3 [Gammaproteobacteria bacterium]HIK97539.1 translation initiation factor IF-3 [Gammaproteobacteria bacterium]
MRRNEQIKASEIRLIDLDGSQIGIVTIDQAMEIAKNKEMDVVEVSPNTTPPVCRIMDYGKYIFEQKKKTQGSKKKQKIIHVKEIKFRPLIEDGDYNVKLGKIINFLEQGDKVKVSLRFRGREMRHTELGENLLNRVCGDIKDIALIEQEAEFEGRQLIMVVAPKPN